MHLKLALAALALTLSAPVMARDTPEPARVYKDWVVGCRWSCEAVVVLPEGDAEGYTLTMSMTAHREVEEGLYFTLHDPVGDVLQATKGPYRLVVDGKVVASFKWDGDAESWTSSVKRRHSTTLANGKMGEIVDKNGNRVSYISLSGATAAMRDMDQRMGIVGYTHALVAKGKKQAKKDRGNGPNPMRAVLANEPKKLLSTPPSASDVMDFAIKLSGCADDRDEVDARFDEIYPLIRYENKSDVALILVGCGHGAYNYNVMPMLATRVQPKKWVVTAITVDDHDYQGDFPRRPLTNVSWNVEKEQITHYNKGRGLGDCGDSAIYQISGNGSAQVEEIREMPICRGATYWPRIW